MQLVSHSPTRHTYGFSAVEVVHLLEGAYAYPTLRTNTLAYVQVCVYT